MLLCAAGIALTLFPLLLPASASPTPTPTSPGTITAGTNYLQTFVVALVGVGTVGMAVLMYRLVRRKENREARRDQIAAVAKDPTAVLRINRDAKDYRSFINEHLAQIFADLSAISELRLPHIDERHPLLIRPELLPTPAQGHRYKEVLKELDQHVRALSDKAGRLRALLVWLTHIPSSPLAPDRLAQALGEIDYLVSRLRQPATVFPDEARRLLSSATEAFADIDAPKNRDNQPP